VKDDLAVSFTASAGDDTKKAMENVEISVISAGTFHTFLNKEKFCCTPDDVTKGKCSTADKIVPLDTSGQGTAQTSFHKAIAIKDFVKTFKMETTADGMYYVMISNCGLTEIKATLSGSIQAKSMHGFLAGVDYHSMHFCGAMLIVYSVFLLGWAVLCFRWKNQLFSIHYAISFILFLACLDMSFRYGIYNFNNYSESDTAMMQLLVHCGAAFKNLCSLALLLSICIGWGTVTDSLGSSNVTWMMVLGVAYIMSFGVRVSATWGSVSAKQRRVERRSGNQYADMFLQSNVLYSIPEALACGLLLDWCHQSLKKLMEALLEQKQNEKYQIFSKLYMVLSFALIILVGGVVCDMLFLQNQQTHEIWSKIWIFDEGMPNMIYMFILAAIMYLWMPNENFARYAFSQQINYDDAELDEIIGSGIELEAQKPAAVEADEEEAPQNPKYLE